jgi:hypothetical protein
MATRRAPRWVDALTPFEVGQAADDRVHHVAPVERWGVVVRLEEEQVGVEAHGVSLGDGGLS